MSEHKTVQGFSSADANVPTRAIAEALVKMSDSTPRPKRAQWGIIKSLHFNLFSGDCEKPAIAVVIDLNWWMKGNTVWPNYLIQVKRGGELCDTTNCVGLTSLSKKKRIGSDLSAKQTGCTGPPMVKPEIYSQQTR